MLCFRFVTKTVLTQGCFCCSWAVLTQHQGLFCFSCCPASEQAGVHKKLGGDTASTGDPSQPGGYSAPYDVVLSNKSWGRKRKGGLSELWHLFSQVTMTLDGTLLCWRRLNTSLPISSSEWIPYFASLAHAAFATPLQVHLSQFTTFLTFTLLILSLCTAGGRVSKQLHGAKLPVGVKTTMGQTWQHSDQWGKSR